MLADGPRDEGLTAPRLNARVAQLYQLSRQEFEHVLATFPLIRQADRDAALKCFIEHEWSARL